jgi:hypothetical protein
MLALATRRADADEADSAEAVALLWTLSEETDCAATSELGEVGVIAVVLFVEIVRIAGSVLMAKRAPVPLAGAVAQMSLM